MAMTHPSFTEKRRRRWPWILAVLAVIFAGGWSVAWYFAAGKVESTIAGWRAREAKAGRVYACASQTIGGFPFRIEVHCASPSAEFRNAHPPAALAWKDLHVVANVFSPTRLVSELTSPMTIGEVGREPNVRGTWRQGYVTVRGLPTSPDSATLTLVEPDFQQIDANGESIFKAQKAELTGRIVEGSAAANPVIQFDLMFAAATAPRIHPVAAVPTDGEATALLRGLKNFAPKSWAARFRELQAAGGRLEVTKARMQQGEVIAVTTGQLGLSPRGRLDGELRTTVVNLEQLLSALGLDRMVEKATAQGGKLDSAFNALDKLVPGLGNVARQNAAPVVVAGVGLLGQPTELEGKKAMMVPLRFQDGMATLGPFPLGPTPPLY